MLRKALVVAAKLDVPELRTLCEHELGGYGESQAPEYRKIEGQVKVHNPYHGWQPVLIANPDYARRVSERYVNQSIGELEDLLGRESDGMLQMPYSPEMLQHWADEDFMQMGLVLRS